MGPESDIQFLARMIVASREGHQIVSADATRLNNIATYGDSLLRGDVSESRTTMPEERRDGSVLPGEVAPGAEYPVVRG
jgi:hypothetical protein